MSASPSEKKQARRPKQRSLVVIGVFFSSAKDGETRLQKAIALLLTASNGYLEASDRGIAPGEKSDEKREGGENGGEQ